MAPLLLVIALVLQSTFIYADTDAESKIDEVEHNNPELDVPEQPPFADEEIKEFKAPGNDWVDLFLLTSNPMFPTSSAAMMAHATNNITNQTSEEQLENIKKMAEDISQAIQSEMASLLNFAMLLNKTENNETVNNSEDNSLRKRRSVETAMDSTQLVMRLLKHIKSNNEYQNIAIEKMMSAQEIADKFGIEFNPDPEILSDLAVAANDHAQELTSMLKDACDMQNANEKVEFVPMNEQPKGNESYYVYALHPEEQSSVPPFEYTPDILPRPQQSVNHVGYNPEHHSHHCHSFESQIPPPHVHYHTSSPSNFYDPSIYSSDSYNPYVEPFSTILIPVEEPEPEPEMVGEEIEETITTKLSVDRGDEPGSSTVNHVTSYTVAEKSHFKKPLVDKYPQQFKYCFFLI